MTFTEPTMSRETRRPLYTGATTRRFVTPSLGMEMATRQSPCGESL